MIAISCKASELEKELEKSLRIRWPKQLPNESELESVHDQLDTLLWVYSEGRRTCRTGER